MSKNKRQTKKAKNSRDTLTLIKARVVGIYSFLMLVVFVLYAPRKYRYIGNHKIGFFEKVTGAFLVVALILLTVSLIKSILKKEKIKLALTLPEKTLLLYGAWNLISFMFSYHKRTALFGYNGWHTGLFMQLALIAVFFAVGRWKSKTDILIKASAVVLIIECLMVVLQRFGFDPFGFYAEMGFMDWNRRNLLGTMGNTNWLMGYEIIIIPVLLMLYLNAKELSKRILWGIGNFIMLSALFLQGSASGIVAFGIILLFLIWVYIKDADKLAGILEITDMIFLFWSFLSIFRIPLIEPEEKDTTRFYTLLWLIPLFLLGIIIAMLHLYIKKKGTSLPKGFAYTMRICMISGIVLGFMLIVAMQFSDKLWQAFGSIGALRITDNSGSFRILLWKQCLKHYLLDSGKREFLFGVGPDAFGCWYKTKNIVIPQVGGPFMDAVYTNAHNDLLTAVVNLGIPGVLVYIGVFISMAVTAVKSFSVKENKVWAMTPLLIIIGYVANNIFSFQTVCSTPIFFIIIALLLSSEK